MGFNALVSRKLRYWASLLNTEGSASFGCGFDGKVVFSFKDPEGNTIENYAIKYDDWLEIVAHIDHLHLQQPERTTD